MTEKLQSLITDIHQCKICSQHFAHDPRPIVQLGSKASILIAGQAPGRKVQESGIPFNDASGDRLREWMGISRDIFYDANKIVILPMGFCYPGHGNSGDLPPRKECAPTWRQQVLDVLPNIQLTLIIGKYAMDWHLGRTNKAYRKKTSVTETVKAWGSYSPEIIPLPHPSPRNNIWLRKNIWFEDEVLPAMKNRINEVLS